MLSAGLVIALLAVSVDAALIAVQRVVVSPGVSGRFPARSRSDRGEVPQHT